MKELENLKWQFEELIKTLISISSSFDDQKYIYGVGMIADEMLEDFYTYYVLNKKRYIEDEIIDNESIRLLDEIDTLTDKWSAEKDDSFWFEIGKNANEWNLLRKKAKNILKGLGKEHLTIEVNRKNILNKQGELIGEQTNIILTER